METSRDQARRRGRRPVPKRKRAPERGGSGDGRDGRRLLRLAVSLGLFLLVYFGRGIFPGQVEAWRNALTSDVDFQGAFQRFGQSVSEGEPMRDALQRLCVTVFGGSPEEPEPAPEPDGVQVVPLSQTSHMGLDWLAEHGALARGGAGEPDPAPTASEPPAATAPVPTETPTPTPEPTPSPAVVTAVAQSTDDQGRKLPSNVSFEHYELGLEKTVNPVEGSITSYFGYRDSPVNGVNEFHLALDIGAREGAEIGAFADGTVRYIGESDEFGKYLCIDHANNVATFYAHCSKLLVSKGQKVSCGETVALVGHTGNATGPHLHLTILKDNIRLDPIYYVDY